MMKPAILIQNLTQVPQLSAEQWLQTAAGRLALPDARREARALLLGVLQKPMSWLYSHGDSPLKEEEIQRLEHALRRRAQGEPLAYILGNKPFWDMELHVSPAVLCPRPETEMLVEACLEKTSALRTPTIVDLGTGSGAIALALARARPDACLLATDLSPEALAVAQRNARQWAPRVQLVQSRWLEAVTGPFDAIVSNPPYIEAGNPWLESDGTCQEPRGALVAEQHGLADLLAIIKQAPARLNPGGWLMLEHGHAQSEAVQTAMKKAGFRDMETRLDPAGLPRITLGRKPTPAIDQAVQSTS